MVSISFVVKNDSYVRALAVTGLVAVAMPIRTLAFEGVNAVLGFCSKPNFCRATYFYT